MVNVEDIISVNINEDDIKDCIERATHISKSIADRTDLHSRDYLERFINVLMGEIAEHIVITWLRQNNKFVESAVDKTSDKPDLGHDLWLKKYNGDRIKCSIKSSISALKSPKDILTTFTIATKESEIRDVNIQVYFWLDLFAKDNNRLSIPSTKNCAIICWCGKKDIKSFTEYKTEKRQTANKKLQELRTMRSLLNFIS